jgi:murein DD-endopeptidase MepM/ murein hydrolase activator NlpD
VRNAGGQVPGSRDVQRTVRDVLVVWQWLLSHLSEMLHPPEEEGPSIGSSVGSTAASGSSVSLSSGGPAGTATTSSGPSRTVSAPAWRLVAPPEDWRNAEAIDASELPVLERLAARLGLRHHRDDVQRKVYVGVPGSEPVAASGRLIVPVPGATAKNSGAYPADTGLDIIVPVGSPVVAAGSGKIVYSEHGHTPWVNPPDTPNSILIRLDTPFVYQGRMYPFTWYTHLSRLRFSVPDDGPHVAQGETIGWTGTGNRVPHLHFGVVYDRPQTVYVPPLTLAAYFGWTSR